MELVKNKASGRYFVLLDDNDESTLLVITPEGKIKLLERRLFNTPDLSDTMITASLNDNITKEQIDIYKEIFKK